MGEEWEPYCKKSLGDATSGIGNLMDWTNPFFVAAIVTLKQTEFTGKHHIASI